MHKSHLLCFTSTLSLLALAFAGADADAGALLELAGALPSDELAAVVAVVLAFVGAFVKPLGIMFGAMAFVEAPLEALEAAFAGIPVEEVLGVVDSRKAALRW